MTRVAPAAAPRPARTPPHPFSFFLPTKISMARDGGTIKLDGMLNRSVTAHFRMDGRIGSPTRGQFYVSTKHFLKSETAERKMSLDELRGLQQAVNAHVKKSPGNGHYTQLQLRLVEAIEKATPAKSTKISKIPTNITGTNSNASVDASLWVNLMPGRGGGPRQVIGSVTVKGVGFNDAPPTFKVPTLSVYEKGTDKLVATFKNPKLVDSSVRRGQKEQSYRLEIDQKKIELKKEYTIVVDAGINGDATKKVRSEHLKIGKVY
jgi:hypothetical protein